MEISLSEVKKEVTGRSGVKVLNSINNRFLFFACPRINQNRRIKDRLVSFETRSLSETILIQGGYLLLLIIEFYLCFIHRTKSIGFFGNQKPGTWKDINLEGITTELNNIYFLFLSHREEFYFVEKWLTLTASLLLFALLCLRFSIGKQGIVEDKETLYSVILSHILNQFLTLLYRDLSPSRSTLGSRGKTKRSYPKIF